MSGQKRIKDLPTRSSKLFTGSAYLAADAVNSVDKVSYATLAQELIEEFDALTLAGEQQSPKDAIDGLADDLDNTNDILDSIRNATASDEGKFLKAKTIERGKVTEWEFDETVTLDQTLSIQGKAADAKAVGDEVSDLKSRINDVYGEHLSLIEVQKNLFDFNDARNTSGQYWKSDGTLVTGTNAAYYTSHPITIPAGTYKFNSSKGTFGNDNGRTVAVIDSSGNLEKIILGTLDGNIAIFTVSETCTVQFNTTRTNRYNTVFCKSSLWDGNYHPYKKVIKNEFLYLENQVDEEDTTFITVVKGTNLLDISEPIEDKYFVISNNASATMGTLVDASSSINVSSFYVKLDGAGGYITRVDKDLYGTSANKLTLFDKKKNFVGIVEGTLGEYETAKSVPCAFTITDSHIGNGVEYVGLVVEGDYIDTTMVVKSNTYPTAYSPYVHKITVPDLTIEKEQIVDFDVDKEDTTFFENIASDNILDLSGAIPDKYFSINNGSLVDSTYDTTSVYVKLKGAGTYRTKANRSLYGTNAAKVALFDSSKTYIKTITGTLGEYTYTYDVPVEFTISSEDASATYFGLTIDDRIIDQIMVVKDMAYPTTYVPYFVDWRIPVLSVVPSQVISFDNPLYQKTVVFDGDSICAPTTAFDKYANIIAKNNIMTYKNYAVGGGTITSGMYNAGGSARHWVSGTVDTMYSEYPNADYIIFEGGTNDADLIGSILNGNIPEKFGSVTDMDFSGEYDDETFCGAVETVFYKAMQHWPSKKIGFIIAMKMGHSGTSYNNRYAYFQKIMDICKKWGVPYLNLWDECPMNPRLESCYDSTKTAQENIDAGKLYQDGQHPTPLGQQVIASKIEAWMRTL